MVAAVETMVSCRNEVPWHKLGTVIPDEGITSIRALELAGLDWKVRKDSVYRSVPVYNANKDIVDYRLEVIEDKVAIVRNTDDSYLGTVGKRYEPLQNHHAFEFMDQLLLSHGANYETAGSLWNGKKIWLLAKLPDTVKVNDDDHAKFLFLSNSHDGSMAIHIAFTTVRIVCNNTLNLALSGMKNFFRISHTPNMMGRVEEARTILGVAPRYYEDVERFMKALSQKDFGKDQMKGMAEIIFGVKTDKPSPQSMNNVNRLVDLFDNGVGNDRPGVRGTAYAALNAATEFDSFYRTARGDSHEQVERRMSRIWTQQDDTIQYKTANYLTQLIAA